MEYGKRARMLYRGWLLPILGLLLSASVVSCSAADLMKDGSPGEWCRVENGLPYYFVNVGQGPLTVTYTPSDHSVVISGTAKLLPLGRVCTDTEFALPMDEGSIARAVDAAGQVDWSGLSSSEQQRAEGYLKFCRAVAQYEAKQPVTEWETVDGEPARIMYQGKSGGSCGAYGTDLRFELLGDDMKKLYQLKPSGRYRVYGTIRVVQTGQICKDGWIDKNGKVISSQNVGGADKPASAQTIRGKGAEVTFSGIDPGYAKGLLAVAVEARRIYAEAYHFDVPNKVTLAISKVSQNAPALWTDGNSAMFLNVLSNTNLAPPGQGGAHNIFGVCHEIGHMVMYRRVPADGLPEGVGQGWADYTGSVVVDRVFKKLGQGVWPKPYNYAQVEGTARLSRQASDPNGAEDSETVASLAFYKAHKRFGEAKVMAAMKSALDARPASKDLMPRFVDELVKITGDKSAREMFPEELQVTLNTIMQGGKTGDWCIVERGLPYYFENVGQDLLTVVYVPADHKLRIRGKAKLLPTGKVYEDTEFALPMDEGSIARAADSAGQVDWGKLPENEQRDAAENLKFCRAVAQYEAKQPVTEWDTVDGEPARLMYQGTSGGSCGAYGTSLCFELLGNDMKRLLQLRPSGRYRVYGTIRVMQTNQTCKDGWIDRDGKVTSSEK